jgi:hypothetical protein
MRRRRNSAAPINISCARRPLKAPPEMYIWLRRPRLKCYLGKLLKQRLRAALSPARILITGR